jgi:hypothetical protein
LRSQDRSNLAHGERQGTHRGRFAKARVRGTKDAGKILRTVLKDQVRERI